MLAAIRQWVIKTMMKGQTGVVQTMPKQQIIEMNTQITAERIMRNGINPEDLKTVGQVENVINQIRASKKIISSSLHGIIVAEMLNKEAVWLQLPASKKSETDAKYQDYYQSTKRYDVIPAKTLEDAMKITKPNYDDTRLYESFYECLNYGEDAD